MHSITEMLAGGSLISDGRADEVAQMILENPGRFSLLVDALQDSDDLVRSRAAHAVEKICRTMPQLALSSIDLFERLSYTDPVPMVKWHIAMIYGHLSSLIENVDQVVRVLFHLLDNEGVFVKSWAITSLAIIGKKQPSRRNLIIAKLKTYQNDPKASIRSRAKKALHALKNEQINLPMGWLKSEQ